MTPTCRDAAGSSLGVQAPCGRLRRGSGDPSFQGPVLTEPLHPPHLPTSGDDMQAELGDPWAGEGSCGKLCPGHPTGLGGTCCEPQGRRKQGKTRWTTFWKRGVAQQRHRKDHASGTTGGLSPRGEARAATLVIKRPHAAGDRRSV